LALRTIRSLKVWVIPFQILGPILTQLF
jgi:hypothetical protein